MRALAGLELRATMFAAVTLPSTRVHPVRDRLHRSIRGLEVVDAPGVTLLWTPGSARLKDADRGRRRCEHCDAYSAPATELWACYADGCFQPGAPRIVDGRHRSKPPWPSVVHQPMRVWRTSCCGVITQARPETEGAAE
jgi:hypothetical protein